MRNAVWRGAAWSGAVLAVLMLGLSSVAHAEVAFQRQELAAAMRQLDALERLVQHSEANAPVSAGQRYYFDYSRLLSDLTQVRTGIETYLASSRAQPRDLAELSGDYRSEQAVTAEKPRP